MNIKLQRALFLLKHPCRIVTNYKTDEQLDEFVRELIEHKDEVEHIKTTRHEIVLRFRGKIFGLWRANYPYAALSTVYVYDNIERAGHGLPSAEIKNVMPSQHTIDRFFRSYAKENQNAPEKSKVRDVIVSVLNANKKSEDLR